METCFVPFLVIVFVLLDLGEKISAAGPKKKTRNKKDFYSALSATIGSTFVTRRAGSQQAKAARANNNAGVPA